MTSLSHNNQISHPNYVNLYFQSTQLTTAIIHVFPF